MLQAAPPPPASPAGAESAARRPLSLQRKVYLVRLTCTLMILALLVAHGALCHGNPGEHGWLLLAGLLYPHVGNLLFGQQDIGRGGSRAVFLADGLFAGAVVAALGYAPAPALVLAVINLFNWMVVGGPLLVVAGALCMLAGMLATGADLEFPGLADAQACPGADWLAALIALVYFAVVARIIHRLLTELRLRQIAVQARSDSAGSAQALAEQALLAVLPRSAARIMEETGHLPDEEIGDATLLLLDLAAGDGTTPPLDDLKDALAACEFILERRGLEPIKTFGRRIVVLGRRESAADDAFEAFREIDAYFGNPATGRRIVVHAALHAGRACLGLVQPARLNLDLAGPAIDELLRLADPPAGRKADGLVVSPAAYRKLSDKTRLAAGGADGADSRSCFFFYPAGSQA